MRRGAVVLAFTIVGCDKPRETPPAPTPVEAPPAPTPKVEAPAPIPDAELRALLTRWIDAQNAGDFAAYEALYATKFLGVKRAGERTTSFARDTWLKDRKRMFAKPMKVEALEPTLRAAAESAEITFTQRWASGTYSDVGPKRLLVVHEGKALKIAHEEMLHSQLVEAKKKADAPELHFTLALRSGLYMVLPKEQPPAQHGAIAQEDALRDAQGMYITSAQVDEAKLAPSTVAWKARKLRLDDGCVAEVDGFVLLARVEPHFGTVQTWKGDGEQPALDAAQVAKEAFALTEPQLAARLRGCTQGTFAQPPEAPVLAEGAALNDEALLQKARDAFTKLPNVQALQRRHREEAEDGSGNWWDGHLVAQAFRHPSGQTLISVQADNGGACADFSAAEWALFELRDGKLARLRDGQTPGRVTRALDVDGDGRLELLVEQPDFSTDVKLVSPDKAWPEPSLTHSYQDCPC